MKERAQRAQRAAESGRERRCYNIGIIVPKRERAQRAAESGRSSCSSRAARREECYSQDGAIGEAAKSGNLQLRSGFRAEVRF